MDTSPTFWRKCSSCKKPIAFRQPYWVCNVSTCNRVRTGLVFCTVSCWDAHVPMMNHRESWALENRAPSAEEAAAAESEPTRQTAKPRESREREAAPAPVAPPRPTTTTVLRRGADGATQRQTVALAPDTPAAPVTAPTSVPSVGGDGEILIVVSKLKAWIRDRSGMNTSDAVAALLSQRVRAWCEEAILSARQNGRKTVLDRDL